MLSLEIMPPLMFGGLVVFLLIGFPVAFSLAATGLFFGEHTRVLQFAADGFVRLLQMAVLPYLTVSIVASIGAMEEDGVIEHARAIGTDILGPGLTALMARRSDSSVRSTSSRLSSSTSPARKVALVSPWTPPT